MHSQTAAPCTSFYGMHMSTIVSPLRIRYRAKLDRPAPTISCTNSSQVRRLIAVAMGAGQSCPKRMKLIRRWWAVGVAIAMVALTAGIATVMTTSFRSVAKAKPIVVSTLRLSPTMPCTITKVFSGQQVPGRKSELGFLTSGRVKRVLVSQGDRVQAGDVLAELESSNLKAELAIAKTELKWAQQNLESMRDSVYAPVRRTRSGSTSISINQESSAQARAEHWSAVVSRIELLLEQSLLRAPYQAVVTETLLSDGSIVTPDRVVVKVVGCDETIVKVSLPAKYTETLKDGESYNFAIGSTSQTATLKAVMPELNEAQQTRDALFVLSEPSTLDAAVQIQLQLAVPTNKSGFRIPRSAVSWEKDGSTNVALVRAMQDSNQKSSRRMKFSAIKEPVEILQASDEGWVMIQGKLRIDDRIVAVMPEGLKSHQPVVFSDFLQWRQEAWLTMP